jgi:cellulose synthase operon protein C
LSGPPDTWSGCARYERAAAGGGDGALAVARYRAGLLAGVAAPERPLEEWLQRNPNDATALTLLAEQRQQNGNAAGAIAYYERAIAIAPGNVTALNNLAVLYQARKDPRALATAELALAAAPDNPAVKDTVGWLLLEKGELDRSLPLLSEAAKALPDLAEVQYHYGVALARKGDVVEARRILEQVAGSKAPAEVVTGATRELAKLAR